MFYEEVDVGRRVVGGNKEEKSGAYGLVLQPRFPDATPLIPLQRSAPKSRCCRFRVEGRVPLSTPAKRPVAWISLILARCGLGLGLIPLCASVNTYFGCRRKTQQDSKTQ